jgi:hypothetical protein
MAADSVVKLQEGPGTWVSWMNHPPRTVKCGENRPDMRSQRLVELSTMSNDCTRRDDWSSAFGATPCGCMSRGVDDGVMGDSAIPVSAVCSVSDTIHVGSSSS